MKTSFSPDQRRKAAANMEALVLIDRPRQPRPLSWRMVLSRGYFCPQPLVVDG